MNSLRRGRSIGVSGFLLAGAIGIISSTQTWLTVERADAAADIVVPGADALPLLATLSLAVLALGAALSITGLILRYVFAAFGAATALLMGWSTAQVLFAAPMSAVGATVTAQTGLAGASALDDIVAAITPTFWPALALAGWLILLAASVFVFMTARRWKSSGRRFRTDTPSGPHSEGPVDAVESWDELSRGTDPTQ